DDSGLALGDNRFGLFGIDDHADDADRQAGFAPHVLGDRHIEPRIVRPAAFRRDVRRGNVHIIETGGFERLGHFDRVVRGEPAFDPIGAGDAGTERNAAWRHRTYVAYHVQRKPHAAFERTAELIIAFIGQRRNETV